MLSYYLYPAPFPQAVSRVSGIMQRMYTTIELTYKLKNKIVMPSNRQVSYDHPPKDQSKSHALKAKKKLIREVAI